MRRVARLWFIAFTVLRFGLDEVALGSFRQPWVRLLVRIVTIGRDLNAPRGVRLRQALERLGPIFVKFGQILSTRRDLLPADVADALALLRDRVQPFDGAEARRIIEAQLGQPIDALYAEFDETPLASASIAQVHAARLRKSDGSAGRAVVVKVVRPGIDRQIDADLSLLKALAEVAAKTHPRADKIRPHEVVAEIETTLRGELDLQREGANASVLRRFWLDSDDLYVPEVFWTHSHERVLTLERVTGIPSDDIAALEAAGISREKLAAKGVRVFYTQVFRDNFFHADAHAGNIWVDDDPARRDNPRPRAIRYHRRNHERIRLRRPAPARAARARRGLRTAGRQLPQRRHLPSAEDDGGRLAAAGRRAARRDRARA
jgi:ubiquinone biosynthesis protein